MFCVPSPIPSEHCLEWCVLAQLVNFLPRPLWELLVICDHILVVPLLFKCTFHYYACLCKFVHIQAFIAFIQLSPSKPRRFIHSTIFIIDLCSPWIFTSTPLFNGTSLPTTAGKNAADNSAMSDIFPCSQIARLHNVAPVGFHFDVVNSWL